MTHLPQTNPVLRDLSNFTRLENKSALKQRDEAVCLLPAAKLKFCDAAHVDAPVIQGNIENIDEKDFNNPQLAAIYVNEIYDYMHSLELKFTVREHYLSGRIVTPKMRELLIDWLIQVHKRFQLLQETLFLGIQVLDRFLQNNDIDKKHLQLVGITSLLIASKYEEQYSPEVNDFVYVSDNAYTAEEIKRMERRMLKDLDISLGKPLCLHFLRRDSKAAKVDLSIHALAKYLMELTLMDYESVHILPSKIAAASLYLALKLKSTRTDFWSPTLKHYTRYSFKDIKSVVARIAQLQLKLKTSKYQTIKQKYSSSKLLSVSVIPQLSSPMIEEIAKL